MIHYGDGQAINVWFLVGYPVVLGLWVWLTFWVWPGVHGASHAAVFGLVIFLAVPLAYLAAALLLGEAFFGFFLRPILRHPDSIGKDVRAIRRGLVRFAVVVGGAMLAVYCAGGFLVGYYLVGHDNLLLGVVGLVAGPLVGRWVVGARLRKGLARRQAG